MYLPHQEADRNASVTQAVATLSLAEEAWEQMVILKLENDEFARLEFNWK